MTEDERKLRMLATRVRTLEDQTVKDKERLTRIEERIAARFVSFDAGLDESAEQIDRLSKRVEKVEGEGGRKGGRKDEPTATEKAAWKQAPLSGSGVTKSQQEAAKKRYRRQSLLDAGLPVPPEIEPPYGDERKDFTPDPGFIAEMNRIHLETARRGVKPRSMSDAEFQALKAEMRRKAKTEEEEARRRRLEQKGLQPPKPPSDDGDPSGQAGGQDIPFPDVDDQPPEED